MADEPGWHETPPDVEQEIDAKLAQQRAMEHKAAVDAALRRLAEAQQGEFAATEEASLHAERVERAAAEVEQAFIAAAIDWLQRKWGSERECPYCGNLGWSISTPFNVLLESRETLSPHFAAMCTNCGNTVFINAILAGLVNDEDVP